MAAYTERIKELISYRLYYSNKWIHIDILKLSRVIGNLFNLIPDFIAFLPLFIKSVAIY